MDIKYDASFITSHQALDSPLNISIIVNGIRSTKHNLYTAALRNENQASAFKVSRLVLILVCPYSLVISVDCKL